MEVAKPAIFSGEVGKAGGFIIVKIVDDGLYLCSLFIFIFHFIFIFLFLEQLRLGFISHAVTSVTN